MGTLQVGGTTLGVKNTVTNKVDLSNTGTLDNLPFYACRAWVNFDGTKDTSGAPSTANTNRLIRGSGNVASVLRNGTGDYTVNFTTPMPDTDYADIITLSDVADNKQSVRKTEYSPSTTSRRFECFDGYGVQDNETVTFAVFR